MEFEQYELLIQELTPLNINQDFEGYILPKFEDEKRRRIQINLIKFKMEFILKLIIKKLFSLKMIYKILLLIINLMIELLLFLIRKKMMKFYANFLIRKLSF